MDTTNPPDNYGDSPTEAADLERPDNAAKRYSELREEEDGGLLQRLGTDASEWATEFLTRFLVDGAEVQVDIDTLRGWFANAIESGRTAGGNYEMTLATDSAKKLGVDLTEVYTIGHLVEVVHTHGHPKFQNETELEGYLVELDDAGQECQVPLLDANGIVWLTYGEEHSSGGEACVHHLVQGDPTENFATDLEEGELPKSEDDYYYIPTALGFPKYPLTLLYAPPVGE